MGEYYSTEKCNSSLIIIQNFVLRSIIKNIPENKYKEQKKMYLEDYRAIQNKIMSLNQLENIRINFNFDRKTSKKYFITLCLGIQNYIENNYSIKISLSLESFAMCFIFLKYFCYIKYDSLKYCISIKDILELIEYFSKFPEIGCRDKKLLREKIDKIVSKMYYVKSFYSKLSVAFYHCPIMSYHQISYSNNEYFEFPKLLFLIKKNYFFEHLKKEVIRILLKF